MSVKFTNTSDKVRLSIKRVLRGDTLTLNPEESRVVDNKDLIPDYKKVTKQFTILKVEDSEQDADPKTEEKPDQEDQSNQEDNTQQQVESSESNDQDPDTAAEELANSVNKDKLVESCEALDLDTNGTKAELARRLVDAGITEV